MAVNDPVADFLTRIRNALSAQHDSVLIPASKFKVELARILKEQGYIEDYGTEPARVGEALRVSLKYTEDRSSVISGPPHVRPLGRDPQDPRRHGHHDHVDLARRHDRPRGQAPVGRRRSRRLRVVILR